MNELHGSCGVPDAYEAGFDSWLGSRQRFKFPAHERLPCWGLYPSSIQYSRAWLQFSMVFKARAGTVLLPPPM